MKEKRLYIDARSAVNMDALRSFCYIRSSGHYIPDPYFQSIVTHVSFVEIFWCVSGSFYFEYEGEIVKLSQDQTFCLLPGDLHKFYAEKEPAELYYICFKEPGLDYLIRTFDLKRGIADSGPCPKELFDSLISELRENTLKNMSRANVLGYEILNCFANPFPAGQQSVATAFQELVRENYQNMDFSIEEAAELLKIHRSTLHRIFLRDCGVSPQEYLMTCRLQSALQLLEHSSYSIKELSQLCGFASENYFARVFKNTFQVTPSIYRKKRG